VNSVWLIFGTLVARALRDPRKSRIANVIFAVLLVASVALALL
jgi:threonine/homoserine/homoserine lactone efflux protein